MTSNPMQEPASAASFAGVPWSRLVVSVALGGMCLAKAEAATWQPVTLGRYPQKIATCYPPDTTNAPAALQASAAPAPVGNLTASARATDGAVWLGTTQGLMRVDFAAAAPDRWQYFAGRRYLPDDAVLQVEPDAAAGVWVRTRTGIAHLELRPMTLAEKAAHFEARIRSRHDRYGLVADCRLTRPGDPTSHQPLDNDNDGLWTAIYAAAECFRYAVTRSPEALAAARKSTEAMLFLEEVAGRRGFPARSYIRKGDPLPRDGEWHWTSNGEFYWKGDTSSDEIVGHFFLFCVASDLLPDPELKARIAATARRITDHILAHDYALCDVDGKPTKWGWWGPQKLAREPDERALNSLQWLSFLKTAHHLTGEARYEQEYRKAAFDFGYSDWITRLNGFRVELNYSDEELAMLPLYCLFRYERDPVLLGAYRRALEAWWQNMQREANPLWTFIYLTGQPQAQLNLAPAVRTLYRMPLDTIKWTVQNSHRADLVSAPGADRFGRREALTLLPPDERPVMRWNANPFLVDGGGGGATEDDGAAFLLPYWLGRHYGFLLGE